jgi:hypothetical protein
MRYFRRATMPRARESHRRPPRRAAALLLAAALAACGDERREELPPELAGLAPSGLRVLLVGIDGATFDVIAPLAAAGRLPALAGLMERGSSAPLRSLDPSRSPALWTTVATGHLPAVHGIEDFTSQSRGTPERPALVTVEDRRTLALWNIASALGRSVDVVGWWVTWPAEPVRGRIVSDRVAHTRWESWTGDRAQGRLTFPPELWEEVRSLVVDPLAPPLAELEALAALSDEERRAIREAREPIPFHWPSVLKFGWCEQRSYEEIALALLRARQPDLSLVFLIAVDPVSHTTWHWYEPERFPGVDPAQARRLGALLPRVYEHADRTLARLLELVGDDTVVLVVSDHGFQASGALPAATDRVDLRMFGIEREQSLAQPVAVGMSGVHALHGIFIAAGGPVLRGARFAQPPTLADLTPTVLALLGLPVGADMAGRALSEMLDPAFLTAHPLRSVPSYEGLLARPALPAAGADEDAARRRYLEALGYIE